ncbi:hypothetical protein AMAG_01021 [Allomyces macrogynus ATCC 38327]|uniref:Uncharacterized protein n=1 Tax=Allomyces macrogynus (strain ATCC 38327) TaxID=578462 RepID=A0A0L0RXI5_ALLM3|nr:hypothetical protein AMAG_01021 [Allomyces macrogynus ATCC 38327]|eukprot:KNE55087.1 hypothetical protein AMAG_01021 [Allomyces macrogynus ATCC 38327]
MLTAYRTRSVKIRKHTTLSGTSSSTSSPASLRSRPQAATGGLAIGAPDPPTDAAEPATSPFDSPLHALRMQFEHPYAARRARTPRDQIAFPGTSLVQSSGMGKSRLATMLVEYGVYVIYLNLADGTDPTEYPCPSPFAIRELLINTGGTDRAAVQSRPTALLLILLHAAALADLLGITPRMFLDLMLVKDRDVAQQQH